MSLWADIYKKSPDKARVNQNFGMALFYANRVDEAILIFEKALRNYVEETKLQKSVSTYVTSVNFYNLGIVYKEKGLYKKAMFYLNRALEEFYFSSETHYHLGLCYALTWRLEKAVYHFSKALEFSKNHSLYTGMQASEANIKSSLAVANRFLKEQKERELLKKINK